jgi:CheY-like chemotaxis protein
MSASRPTILVVDDDDACRDAVKELLEVEGYRVASAANGREALDALARRGASIKLALLDLFMPVMDGWQVIDHLREAGGRIAETTIVILTSAPHRAPEGFPILQKPFDADAILGAVKKHC